MIKVTVWNEYFDGQKNDERCVKSYPNGLHNTIADALNLDKNIKATCKIFDDKDYGLSEEVLASTDVLIYWAHCLHDKIPDEVAIRIKKHVNMGMGVIFLHSAHLSKAMQYTLGTSGTLQWREIGEKERLFVCDPSHPIAKDLPLNFELEHEEMYGEPFGIPNPDSTVFLGWFSGGNVFRSGVCFNRGYGKVFYFQPGHETYPIYHDKNIQKVLHNAVLWANSNYRALELNCPNVKKFD